MKKFLFACVSALACLVGLSSLTSNKIGDSFGVEKNKSLEKTIVYADQSDYAPKQPVTITKKEKPLFDAYSEMVNEKRDGKYKFYFFDVAEVSNFPILTAFRYWYSCHVKTRHSFSLDIKQKPFMSDFNLTLNEIVSHPKLTTVTTSSVISSVITQSEQNPDTKTYDYALCANGADTTDDIAYTFASYNPSIQAKIIEASKSVENLLNGQESTGTEIVRAWGDEFARTNSVLAANSYSSSDASQESIGIGDPYSIYQASLGSLCTPDVFDITFDSSSQYGYYSLSLYCKCELYVALCLDTANSSLTMKYFAYPVKDSFDWRYVFSDDSYRITEEDDVFTADLNDVVDYLNYEQTKEFKHVHFESNGGTYVPTQMVKEGQKINLPVEPTRPFYSFGGWYTDKECSKPFAATSAVLDDMTLYAKWDSKLSVECLSYTLRKETFVDKLLNTSYSQYVPYLELKITNNSPQTLEDFYLNSADIYMDGRNLGKEYGCLGSLAKKIGVGRTLESGKSYQLTFACYDVGKENESLFENLSTRIKFSISNVEFIQGINFTQMLA